VTKTLAVAYDAGGLLAADKNDRAVWAEQRFGFPRASSEIVTTDPGDIGRIVSASGKRIPVSKW
jgi:hypothetical protein